MSPTFQVTCAQCGEERWPTAKARPVPYICARCVAVGPHETARRQAQGRKAQQTRQARAARPGGTGEPTEGVAP